MGTKDNHTSGGERRNVAKPHSEGGYSPESRAAHRSPSTTSIAADDSPHRSTSMPSPAPTPSPSEARESLTAKLREKLDEGKAGASEFGETVTNEIKAGVEQAKSAVSDAAEAVQSATQDAGSAIGTAGRSVVDAIRQNPFAAAMVGIGGVGVAMLLMGGTGNPKPGASAPRRGNGHRRAGLPSGDAGSAEGGSNGAEGFVAQAIQQVSQTAGNVATSAQKAVTTMTDETVALGQRAQKSLGRGLDTVNTQVKRIGRTIESNPLKVAAGAVAIGVGVGLLVPGTAREDQWLGKGRDGLVAKVKELAHETLDKVESAAQVVTGKASDTSAETA